MKEMADNRLKHARSWLMVALSYYIVRAIFIVFPHFKDRDFFVEIIEIIQALMSFCIVVGLVISYKKEKLEIIRSLLFIHSIMMVMSNFNVYKDTKEDNNYEALNMLSSVFSIIFTTMDSLVLHFLWETKLQRYLTIVILYTFQLLVLIQTNFIFEEMSYHSYASLTIAIVYLMILIPFFFKTFTDIAEEQEKEVKLGTSNVN
jgi:hypothetical protein